ncbi:ABC transporter permease [Clostridium sp. LP20]|uniref:ABC transporter permease n=1 Tax=Clostridium sp. LP20 TaxID=3418665 RepID=UPI003EE4D378
MRLLIYIKIKLKRMFKGGLVTLAYFLIFPIILAGFTGFIQENMHTNPLKLKVLDINIVDEDDTNMSKSLIEFLKSDDMKEFINIKDDGKADIIIPKGYESSLLSMNKNNIVIKEKGEGEAVINTLKVILDNYHQGIYINIAGGSQEDLISLTQMTTIESNIIDEVKEVSSYERMASLMIGFVITMMIYMLIQSNYEDLSKNIDKKVLSTPINRTRIFEYEFIILLIYSTIIISAYVLFFRILGIAFKGEILGLSLLIFTSAILVTSLSSCIKSFFGEKYGKIVGLVIFMLPIIGMEMFTGSGTVFAELAPTHYISKAFSAYCLNGNLIGVEKEVFWIIAISIGIFIITLIKEMKSKEVKSWV